jgi:hypothetical protein
MSNWEEKKCWIVYFDALGFANKARNSNDSFKLHHLKRTIDDYLNIAEEKVASINNTENIKSKIKYFVFSDTFLFYSTTEEIQDYPWLMSLATEFIEECFRHRFPMRGAISYGDITFRHNGRIIIGKAFVDAHYYAESQNWIGLVLTPSATEELEKHELYPACHGFVLCDVPLKNKEPKELYAYQFIGGSHIIHFLEEMRQQAPENAKIKYDNTLAHIKKWTDSKWLRT